MLELIDGRSAAFRSALAGALGERVPGCPDWTGRDLLAHLGEVQRAGPRSSPPATPTAARLGRGARARRRPATCSTGPSGPPGRCSTRCAAAGPDRPVWSWWGPTTAGRVARHQVQEAGVHGWDAEDTVGRAGAAAAGRPRRRRGRRVPRGQRADRGRAGRTTRSPSGSPRPTCRAASGGSCSAPAVAGWRRARRPATRCSAGPRATWCWRCTVGVRWTAWRSPASQEVARRFLGWFDTE